MLSWSCSVCTFLNPPSQKFTCQICLSPSSQSSSSSSCWCCKACTFSNPITISSCNMCGRNKSIFTPLQRLSGDGGTSNLSLSMKRCSGSLNIDRVDDEKKNILEVIEVDEDSISESKDVDNSDKIFQTLNVLSYNIWFREDVELCKRMESLGLLILQNSPDFIFLQEVTPNIYNIFQSAKWWSDYNSSVSPITASQKPYFCMLLSKLPVKRFNSKPFQNSIMGRELCIAEVEIGRKTLVLATTHLESPCPAPPKWDQMYVKERVAQAKESTHHHLKEPSNVIFGGDMNWNDNMDGPFPLEAEGGWVDPWVDLRPDQDGWTFDTKANKMLSANRKLQRRLDRFFCKFKDFEIVDIDMIGREPIPDVSYFKSKKVGNKMQKLELPVLTSDHFGLLLTVRSLFKLHS